MRRFALSCMLVGASVLRAQTIDIGPAPGKLVDIGGRELHILCSGSGAPTVILEAGASAFSIDWTLVQGEVARTNRVCAYDRAGSAWSDPAPATTDASSVARDLHALLQAARERPPYVLVGASLGGIHIRTYDAEYPREVAGFVFIDPSTEDRLFTMIGGEAVLIASVSAADLATTFPTRHVRVPRRRPQTGAPFDRLPPDLHALRVKLEEKLIASVPDSVSPEVVGTSRETERQRLAALLGARQKSPQPLGVRPVVVLTRGAPPNPELAETHLLLARLSSNSRHSVIAGAGHEIHLFEPGAVVTAIADVARAVREKGPLPSR